MSLRPRVEEFFQPVPLLAVGLLGVNDHWLKPRFHNALTGKLSDLAGCFFVPLFLSALLGLGTRWRLQTRIGLSAAATAALFVAIKVSVSAAELFASALTFAGRPLGLGVSRVLADPTDLIAFPLVLAAVVYALRVHARRDNPCSVARS